jgi:hypothetical protein
MDSLGAARTNHNTKTADRTRSAEDVARIDHGSASEDIKRIFLMWTQDAALGLSGSPAAALQPGRSEELCS